MVDERIINSRKKKNALMINFSILTIEDAKDYEESLERITNIELRAFDEATTSVSKLIGSMEWPRRVHMAKLLYYMAKQTLGLACLTKEQTAELGKMMETEFPNSLLHSLRGMMEGGG